VHVAGKNSMEGELHLLRRKGEEITATLFLPKKFCQKMSRIVF